MLTSKYLKINRIEFMTTYHCPGRCAHCSVGDRLNRPGDPHHVPLEQSMEAVCWLAENYSINSVMTFGGEPLLYPEITCAIHSAARKCGIAGRQLITNGFFSKDPARIHQVAQGLVDAGVNQILLSVDAFHQARIPLEPVMCFARSIVELSPGIIELQPSWVVNERHENSWNERTRQVLRKFDGLGILIGRGDDIFLAGNAIDNLREFYAAPAIDLDGACGSMPYTEPLDRITSLSIVPGGDVMACGFTIGNLLHESIAEITAGYDPYADRRMRALLTGGARGLLALAEELEIEFDLSRCWSVCDLCRQMKDKTD